MDLVGPRPTATDAERAEQHLSNPDPIINRYGLRATGARIREPTHGRAKYARVADSNVEERMVVMADGVYRVTEVIGVSSESWEAAARSAVETAAKTVRDLRIAEVLRQDVAIENGGIKSYRVRLAISFKYEATD
jgi:flavin-binding protein dodecin